MEIVKNMEMLIERLFEFIKKCYDEGVILKDLVEKITVTISKNGNPSMRTME